MSSESQLVGPYIDGKAAGDMFGFNVSISGGANHFIIGATSSRGYDYNGCEHRLLRVYKLPDHV